MTDLEPKPMDPDALAELRSILDMLVAQAAGSHIVPVRGPVLVDLRRLLADRDYQEQRAHENRSDYIRAHGLLCDLNRRLSRALLPNERHPDWDAIVAAAEAVGQGAATAYHLLLDLGVAQAERDEARAEATRLRARVRVDRDDVIRADVTLAHAAAWMQAGGWSEGPLGYWERGPDICPALRLPDVPGAIANVIEALVSHRFVQGCSLDILDEMAAMPTPDHPAE